VATVENLMGRAYGSLPYDKYGVCNLRYRAVTYASFLVATLLYQSEISTPNIGIIHCESGRSLAKYREINKTAEILRQFGLKLIVIFFIST